MGVVALLTIVIFVSQFLGNIVTNMGIGVDDCSIIDPEYSNSRTIETFGEWVGFGWNYWSVEVEANEEDSTSEQKKRQLAEVIAWPIVVSFGGFDNQSFQVYFETRRRG